MGSHNNACRFGEMSYKNEKDMSAEPSYSQKSKPILLDVDFPRNLESTKEIRNEFEESVPEEPNPDYLKSNVI
ncbi:unnamed protein product [Schistosoma mattheei]|uniref:Uncharacterized protein n=1 Tax=Schistosoma mattheei TaxID=31246 RepID=A0A183NJX0_9TREM|nr:unnamed protein product [Schistosoma mattheei]